MRKGHVNQILLITDGCSNHGEDPLAIASLAKEQGITVNVIGIMEENRHDHEAMKEVEGLLSQAEASIKLSTSSSYLKQYKWSRKKQ